MIVGYALGVLVVGECVRYLIATADNSDMRAFLETPDGFTAGGSLWVMTVSAWAAAILWPGFLCFFGGKSLGVSENVSLVLGLSFNLKIFIWMFGG